MRACLSDFVLFSDGSGTFKVACYTIQSVCGDKCVKYPLAMTTFRRQFVTVANVIFQLRYLMGFVES